MLSRNQPLKDWLDRFLSVNMELANEELRITIQSGQSVVFAPVDIFETFKSRGLIEPAKVGGFYFFVTKGERMVKIEPDAALKNEIVLRG